MKYSIANNTDIVADRTIPAIRPYFQWAIPVLGIAVSVLEVKSILSPESLISVFAVSEGGCVASMELASSNEFDPTFGGSSPLAPSSVELWSS